MKPIWLLGLAVLVLVAISAAAANGGGDAREKQVNRMNALEDKLATERQMIDAGDTDDELMIQVQIEIEDLLYYIRSNEGDKPGDWDQVKEMIRADYPAWGERIHELDPTYEYKESPDHPGHWDYPGNKYRADTQFCPARFLFNWRNTSGLCSGVVY